MPQFSFPVDFTSNPIAQIGMQQATNFINRINVPTVRKEYTLQIFITEKLLRAKYPFLCHI